MENGKTNIVVLKRIKFSIRVWVYDFDTKVQLQIIGMFGITGVRYIDGVECKVLRNYTTGNRYIALSETIQNHGKEI